MKKLLICVLLFAVLITLPACQKQDAKSEDIYFISQADYEKKTYVMHYGGGDVIENVYELNSDIACIDGSTLFYAEAETVYKVDLTSGEISEYAVMPDKISQLTADNNCVYAMCRPLFGPSRHVIYKVMPSEYTRIDESGVLNNHGSMLADGGYLFFMDLNTAALMAYNSESGETVQVSGAISGIINYTTGFIYANILHETYLIDIKTGEQTFIRRGISATHGDFIYYAHQLFCESGNNLYEIFRRKGDDIELCGTASLPSMGFHELSDLITFGENGFITQGVKHFDPTEYTYFPYGSTEGITLTVK